MNTRHSGSISTALTVLLISACVLLFACCKQRETRTRDGDASSVPAESAPETGGRDRVYSVEDREESAPAPAFEFLLVELEGVENAPTRGVLVNDKRLGRTGEVIPHEAGRCFVTLEGTANFLPQFHDIELKDTSHLAPRVLTFTITR